MPDLTGPNSPALGFLLALAIGFLVGRTREPLPKGPPRPGMRDFLIIALLGAVAGHSGSAAIAIALFIGTIGALLVMRAQHPERNGITTELAAVATFALAGLCLTSDRQFGAGLGIVLAAILAERDQLRRFVRDAISDREYIDTLSFLALIFIIYPLLPTGSYGPFGFFRPREIWLFVILVSGVSYVGYFLTKFAGNERGALLTAIVGAIASTTAYTAGISRAVADAPDSAIPAARYSLIANSILFPRTLLIVAVVSPMLAVAAVPAFAAMMLAGFAAAMVLAPARKEAHRGHGFHFSQPVFDSAGIGVWRDIHHRAADYPRRQALCGLWRPDGSVRDQRTGGRNRHLADAGVLRSVRDQPGARRGHWTDAGTRSKRRVQIGRRADQSSAGILCAADGGVRDHVRSGCGGNSYCRSCARD